MNPLQPADRPAPPRFDPDALAQMDRLVADLRRLYHERNEALRDAEDAHHESLLRLALAAEYRDDETGVHIVRIGHLAEALALMLGADAAFAAMLRRAAPLHDVGKIGIPDAVLKKPGKLTLDEFRVMSRHPEIGAQLLGRSRNPLFQLAAEVALSHHERHDGTGYPEGRAGEDIPLSGRIVAVVDFFDALTMDRCYRPAFADEEALRMLEQQRAKAFDPHIVDVFLENAATLVALRDRLNATEAGVAELMTER